MFLPPLLRYSVLNPFDDRYADTFYRRNTTTLAANRTPATSETPSAQPPPPPPRAPRPNQVLSEEIETAEG